MKTTVIALFDALGSLDKMKADADATGKLLEMLSDLTRKKRDCLIIDAMVNAREQEDGSIVAGSAIGVLDVQHDSYQDTALMWAIFDRARFWTFCDLASEFFCLALENRIPLRGSISVGEADMDKYMSKTVYSSKPMVEALLAEKAQKWIGVSFGPSFKKNPFRHYFRGEHVLEFYDHCKSEHSDKISSYALDWPRKWRQLYSESPIKILNSMNTDSDHSEYYELAIRFCEKSLRAETSDG